MDNNFKNFLIVFLFLGFNIVACKKTKNSNIVPPTAKSGTTTFVSVTNSFNQYALYKSDSKFPVKKFFMYIDKTLYDSMSVDVYMDTVDCHMQKYLNAEITFQGKQFIAVMRMFDDAGFLRDSTTLYLDSGKTCYLYELH